MENSHPKDICHHILQHSTLRNYRLGVSKVFIKNEDLDLLERDQKTCIVQEPGKIIGNKKNLVLNIDSNNNNAIDEATTPYNRNTQTNSHGVAFASNHDHIDYNNNNNKNNMQFNHHKTTPHLRTNTKSKANPKGSKANEEPDLM